MVQLTGFFRKIICVDIPDKSIKERLRLKFSHEELNDILWYYDHPDIHFISVKEATDGDFHVLIKIAEDLFFYSVDNNLGWVGWNNVDETWIDSGDSRIEKILSQLLMNDVEYCRKILEIIAETMVEYIKEEKQKAG